MKFYLYKEGTTIALALAFNKGHAVKLIAKDLGKVGKAMGKGAIQEIDPAEEKKGKVFLL